MRYGSSPIAIKMCRQISCWSRTIWPAYFRQEIVSGRLAPGEKIVEVKYAKLLKLSQSSVREAINILVGEGFVQKGPGRTAQVTRLTDEDVAHSYELRAVLEGYCARIVAQKKVDLNELEQTLSDMRSAADCNNINDFYERDLQFHLLLAERQERNAGAGP